ncbi:MAG: formylglycine-generating enzyme family protein [Defluviicoccus sp.]
MTTSRLTIVMMKLMAVPALAGSPPVAVAEDPLKPGTVFRDCAECPEMVVIPAGSFMMGAAPGEEKREGLRFRLRNLAQPQHRVSVAAFAAGKYEVTRGEYAAFVKATGRGAGDGCWIWTGQRIAKDPDKSWRDPGYAQDDRHPVACVSWQDARAYTDWLSGTTGKRYRLLSEAEWEYAARAGTTTARFWGQDPNQACAYANGADQTAKAGIPGAAGWDVAGCTDGYAYTAPVGSFHANAFGPFDTLGDVFEWVEDVWHNNYRGAPADGSAWTDGEARDSSRVRVVRGGSWDYVPSDLRSANRGRRKPIDRGSYKGFRVAQSLD